MAECGRKERRGRSWAGRITQPYTYLIHVRNTEQVAESLRTDTIERQFARIEVAKELLKGVRVCVKQRELAVVDRKIKRLEGKCVRLIAW